MKDYNEHVEKLFSDFMQNLLPITKDALKKYEEEQWARSTPVEHQPVSYEQHRKNFKQYNSDYRVGVFLTKVSWMAYWTIFIILSLLLMIKNANSDATIRSFDATGLLSLMGCLGLGVILITVIMRLGAHNDWRKFYNKLPIHIYHIWYIDDYSTSNGHQVRRPDTYNESGDDTQQNSNQ